jgi:hypothetical protein
MEAGIFAELGADVALKREIMVVAAAWLRTLRLSVRARREMFKGDVQENKTCGGQNKVVASARHAAQARPSSRACPLSPSSCWIPTELL